MPQPPVPFPSKIAVVDALLLLGVARVLVQKAWEASGSKISSNAAIDFMFCCCDISLDTELV